MATFTWDNLKRMAGRQAEDPIAEAIQAEEAAATPEPAQQAEPQEMPCAMVGLTIVCRCGQPQIIPIDLSGQAPPVLRCTCDRLFQVQNVRLGFGQVEPEKPKSPIILPPGAGQVLPFPGRIR